MSELLFLVGSLVVTTIGTLAGYFIGRAEAKNEYTKINNRNLRAMNELENEVEELAAKLPQNGTGGWVTKKVELPKESVAVIDPVEEDYTNYDNWNSENISDPLPPATAEESKPKKAKAPEKKKQTPKRKKGKK